MTEQLPQKIIKHARRRGIEYATIKPSNRFEKLFCEERWLEWEDHRFETRGDVSGEGRRKGIWEKGDKKTFKRREMKGH